MHLALYEGKLRDGVEGLDNSDGWDIFRGELKGPQNTQWLGSEFTGFYTWCLILSLFL